MLLNRTDAAEFNFGGSCFSLWGAQLLLFMLVHTVWVIGIQETLWSQILELRWCSTTFVLFAFTFNYKLVSMNLLKTDQKYRG